MDAQDNTTVEQRLCAACSGKQRLVYWQDEPGTYRNAIGAINVPEVTILDATGTELATKRRVLRDEPHARFVVYRAGEEPAPTEDLIYDLRLRAAHFSCTEEGVWAEECGVPAGLVGVLADHAAFFNRKERMAALAKSSLPKQTLPELELAMAAAALGIREGTTRDVARAMARRLVTELARQKDEGLRAITAAGLADSLWRTLRDELGYRVPRSSAPSPQDLAFRLVEGTLRDLVEDEWQMSSAEASRIMGGLASSPRTRDAYEWLSSEYGGAALSLVPEQAYSLDSLAQVEHVPQADRWMLMRLAKDAVAGALDGKVVEDLAARRAGAPCAAPYASHYASLVALARLIEALKRYEVEVPAATTMGELMAGYATSWHLVDRRYRELHLHYNRVLQGRFGQSLAPAVNAAEARYDSFLSDCAARWQEHLLDEGPWPGASLPSQADFFRDHVARRVPDASAGHRVGVIVSDALRYECAADLAERLNASRVRGLAGRSRAVVEARAGMVPSYTQLGMAALLPAGAMEIDPATALVYKGGQPTAGTKARRALIAAAEPNSLAFQADELPGDLAGSIMGAAVVFVYHDVIDDTGDKARSERRTFLAVEDALTEIETLAARLLQAGCGTVLVTSDHGFIYQDRDLEPKDFADVDGLQLLKGAEGVDSERTRRFVVSDVLPKSPTLIEYTSAELSLTGGHLVGTPRGAMRLRLSGSGARFVHGGVSP
ncbi:MAG: BREX-1 system phosphatase PglZ type A, partial [Atopobiaceae bacterium]|nr:BREX-1 system phosphatase PglZ type A [Atopobiaceae bacterium]